MLPWIAAGVLALQAPVIADTSPFRALGLPAPNRVRSASGGPGPDYWQPGAEHVIPVSPAPSPCRPPGFPPPTRVRSASGAPAPDYWQQRANYVLRASLDTTTSL